MTKISWTEKTVNPIIGCSKVSEGCAHCYAEIMAARLAHMGNRPYQNVTGGDYENWFQCWNGKTTFVESALQKVLKRNKPTTWFWCSMGDMFHESVPDEWIDKCFAVMALTPQHTHMVLTKRAARMMEYMIRLGSKEEPTVCTLHDRTRDFHDLWMKADISKLWPLPNVWLGVTAENQATADERIPLLLRTPAAHRYISAEPLLGAIDFKPYWLREAHTLTRLIDLIIVGGESGPGARPMNPQWARDIRDQCETAGTHFHHKQFGEWVSEMHPAAGNAWCNKLSDIFVKLSPAGDDYTGYYMARVGKKRAGRLLDGVTHDWMPGRDGDK